MRHITLRSLLLVAVLWPAVTGTVAPVAASPDSGSSRSRSRAIVLPVGRSIMLNFQRMKRVEVIEPALLEVIVASLNDLSVYGKKAGGTTLFVWDNLGMHQIEVTVTAPSAAELAAENLRRILGPRLSYTISGEKVLVVEGSLPLEEAERAHTILKAASSEGVQVLDLVRVEGTQGPASLAAATALQKMLGEHLQYLVWNDKTLLVQGTVGTQAELERVNKVLEAAGNKDLKIVNMVEYEESQARPPVEEIAQAVGDQYRVWRVQGRTVAVDGVVSSKAELENLDKLIKAFSGRANVLNLVQVVEPKPTINDDLALMQSALGNTLMVRPLGNEALVVEGTVASDEELKRLRALVASVPVNYKVVDALRVATPDKKQVIIHARVVDINRGKLSRLGVNWGQIAVKNNEIVFIDQPWLAQAEGGAGTVFNIGAQVEALAQQNYARILAQPNLLVDDGAQATILVGGEIPIPVAQTGGGGLATVTVEWKTFGIGLHVEPNILPSGDKLQLKVQPEVSSLDFSNAVTIGGFVLPAMRSRKASTQVTMPSGNTLLIAGLLSSEDAKAVRSLPLISKIPVIGELFKRKEFQTGQSELVIMITPEIVDVSQERQ
jgi:Flp pilus assembly secretin CpaC